MTASHLKLKGALDPFYTGTQECLPGGPSFEPSFYLAWTAIIGALFGLLGAALFQVLLSRTWIRFAFWSTTAVSCVAAVVDIIIVQVRWARGGGGEGKRRGSMLSKTPRRGNGSRWWVCLFGSRTNSHGTRGRPCWPSRFFFDAVLPTRRATALFLDQLPPPPHLLPHPPPTRSDGTCESASPTKSFSSLATACCRKWYVEREPIHGLVGVAREGGAAPTRAVVSVGRSGGEGRGKGVCLCGHPHPCRGACTFSHCPFLLPRPPQAPAGPHRSGRDGKRHSSR